MKMNRIFMFLFGLVVLSTGCSEDDENMDLNPEGLTEGVGFLATDDPSAPLVMQHINGERIVTVDENQNGALDALVYTQNNNFLVAHLDEATSLPNRITTSDNTLFIFSYKAGNTLMDVAVVQSGGQVGYVRDIALDLPTRILGRSSSGPMEALQAGLFAVGTALGSVACITAGGGLVISTAGLAIPAAIAACGGLVVSVAGFINSNSDANNETIAQLDNANNVFTILQGVIGCPTGNVGNCLAGIVTSTGLILSEINGIWTQIGNDNIALAEGALNSGFGIIKVTLTWNTTSDIDLWVTDPTGFRIYFAAPNSPSGGFLDVDDTNGFGPENIFWQNEAPTGQYLVQVHYFSDNGDGATNYNVQVEVLGDVEIFNGTLGSVNEVDDVLTFNLNTRGMPVFFELNTTSEEANLVK